MVATGCPVRCTAGIKGLNDASLPEYQNQILLFIIQEQDLDSLEQKSASFLSNWPTHFNSK